MHCIVTMFTPYNSLLYFLHFFQHYNFFNTSSHFNLVELIRGLMKELDN